MYKIQYVKILYIIKQKLKSPFHTTLHIKIWVSVHSTCFIFRESTNPPPRTHAHTLKHAHTHISTHTHTHKHTQTHS